MTKKVRIWPKVWSPWYGNVIDWDKSPDYYTLADTEKKNPLRPNPKGFKLYFGECSHGTSWQIRIDTPRYSWYWVVRLWDFV